MERIKTSDIYAPVGRTSIVHITTIFNFTQYLKVLIARRA